jgi:hypothetical protein
LVTNSCSTPLDDTKRIAAGAYEFQPWAGKRFLASLGFSGFMPETGRVADDAFSPVSGMHKIRSSAQADFG